MTDAGPAHSEGAWFHTGSEPPRTPKKLVARPRLYALLDQTTSAPLTVIVSPAGTGKTVLLAAWAHRSVADTDVLWLAAHDHAALGTHLLQAAGLSRDEAVKRLHGPHDGQDDAAPSLLELVSVAAEGHEPRVLVIDDAHLLAPTQVALLAAVLRKRPDIVRLVLATRRDLALPIVELELRVEASVIRATQLRFAPDEAAELIRAHASDLPTSEVQALQEESRGWAAALVLGARRLRRGREPGAAAPSIAKTDQPVLDFLLGDAFTSLPKEVREVLITTFTEPVVTLERAAVLSGNPNAGALLSELVNDGILVTAYVQGRDRDAVFRYHPLLVELLRRRVVSSSVDAAVAAEGHRRAALHDAALGNRVSALQQAIASRDDELLGLLLIEFGPTLLSAAQDELLTAVMARLPGDALDRFPLLLGVAGLHRRTIGDIPGAVQLANRATATVATLGKRSASAQRIQEDSLRSDAMQLELWQSRYGWLDGSSAISRARRALGCRHASAPASTHRPQIAVGPERQALLMIELGAAEVWAGDLQNARLHIEEAVVHARATGHARPLAAALSHRAVLELVSGAVRTAEATAEQALKLSAHQEVSRDPYIARARMVVAWASFLRLDYGAAFEELLGLESAMSVGVDAIIETYAVLLRACLLTESGRVDEARRMLATTPEAPGRLPAFLLRALTLKRWHCASLAKDSATAAAQVAVLETVGSPAEVELLKALSPTANQQLVTAAKIEGLLEELFAVDPLLAAAAATRRLTLLLDAGDRGAARPALVDVLSRVAPQQILQLMSVGGTATPAMLDLLSEECRRDDAHPFAAGAWTALSGDDVQRHGQVTRADVKGAPTNGRPVLPALPMAGPTGQGDQVSVAGIPIRLTAREADVLEQLALGSSYTEIGKALFITENTVKTHLASLYRKLAVDKRSAALRAARGLGLL